MKQRRFELIFVIAVVASVVMFLRPAVEETGAASPPSTAWTPPSQPLSIGEPVPSHPLKEVVGEEDGYMENTGPYLFVLTATGCGGCLERIGGTDREAHRLATRKGLKVLNLLVYQGLEGSSDFVKQHRPSADRVLCDPSADFSVRTLGGSDATCWILVDSKGRLAWRGPADPAALEVALANLE